MLKEGDKAPDFKLNGIDPEGKEIEISLKDLLSYNKKLILYFYPKDNTSGWTTEAKDFSAKVNEIKDIAIIAGVSPDSVKSHKNFMEKHDLKIYLLSDIEKNVMSKYDAYGEKKMYGKVKMGVIRSTYIIDKNGIILKKWKNVRAKGHADKVIEFLKKWKFFIY